MTEVKRRATIAEEAAQSLVPGSKKAEKLTFKQKLSKFGNQIYNKEYREFLTRDSLAWFKLSLFYFIFYLLLSGFFVLLLVVFWAQIDLKEPTYFNQDSCMGSRQIANPGLGFRPQPDPESEIIEYDVADFKKYFNSLDLFLKKYDENKERNFTGAHGKKVTYDYEEKIKDTPCSKENNYGYSTTNPCVVVKLNRIFGWLPKSGGNLDLNLTKLEGDQKQYYVYIKCNGEGSADKDNLGEISYYSTYPNNEIGGIDFKYFPYRNQPGYLSPLVFVHFKGLTPNTLVNVECKAYAKNIDNSDRMNKRGMVKFQLYATDFSTAKTELVTKSE